MTTHPTTESQITAVVANQRQEIAAGTKVIHKPTRRVGEVLRLKDASHAPIIYTKNTRSLRAIVCWESGGQSSMLVSALVVATEEALSANQAAKRRDRIAYLRDEIARCERVIPFQEERGDEIGANHSRATMARYQAKLAELGEVA